VKALISEQPGGPETLKLVDLPEPAVGPGLLRVRVLACGINYPDVLIIEDRYQSRPQRPFSPGSEISGVVDAVGEGVDDWKQGDRLIAVCGHGGLAEVMILAADRAYHLPDGCDPIEAAALLLTYATSLHALADRAALEPKETLLVLGAAGGVGLAAVEIGKAMGAYVVAAASSEEKVAAARAAGADRVMTYGRGPFERAQLKSLAEEFKIAVAPDGADVIYDPVGGDYCEPALRSIAWEGRYLVVGFPAGIPSLPLNLTLLKSCDVRGVFWGAFATRKPARNRAHVEQLIAWWKEGRIRPRVDRTWPLAEGGDAIRWLAERRAIGKVVVRVTEDEPNPRG
jgi:NADPH:quinone reductase-like Zn-dependent oxidoreductase